MIYTIEKKPYGIRLAFDGMLDLENAKKYRADIKRTIAEIGKPIGVLIDLRNAKPMPPESQEITKEVYSLVLKMGLTRAASIVPSSIMKSQMKRLAKENGTYDKARYIDSSTTSNWEQSASDWIEKGIDPDL